MRPRGVYWLAWRVSWQPLSLAGPPPLHLVCFQPPGVGCCLPDYEGAREARRRGVGHAHGRPAQRSEERCGGPWRQRLCTTHLGRPSLRARPDHPSPLPRLLFGQARSERMPLSGPWPRLGRFGQLCSQDPGRRLPAGALRIRLHHRSQSGRGRIPSPPPVAHAASSSSAFTSLVKAAASFLCLCALTSACACISALAACPVGFVGAAADAADAAHDTSHPFCF